MSPYPTRFSTHTEPSSRLAKWFSDVIEVIGTLAYLMIGTIVGISTGVIMSIWLTSATTFTTPATQIGTIGTIGTSTLLKVVFIGLSIVGGMSGWAVFTREESRLEAYLIAWLAGVGVIVGTTLVFSVLASNIVGFTALGGLIMIVSFTVSFWLSRMLEP